MPPRLQIPPNCDLTLGLRCLDKSVPGRTVWSMPAAAHFANPLGVVQGGFLAALADSAMATAAVTFLEGRPAGVVNVEMKISFLGPARAGTTLVATAVVVKGGRRLAFAEVDIVDDGGAPVARASSTFLYSEV